MESVLKDLPALRKPTISKLSDPSWVAVELLLKKMFPRIDSCAQRVSAEGIVEFPPNKLVP